MGKFYGSKLEIVTIVAGVTVVVGYYGFLGVRFVLRTAGNRDMVDLTKSFNAVLEEKESGVSLTYISSYNDFSGSQIQFHTQDGMVVLADTKDIELLNQPSEVKLKDYAKAIAGNPEQVKVYDELMGLSFPEKDSFNKSYVDVDYTFNHAILETNNGVVIVNIDQWRDYESDNKVQLKLTDGTVILKDFEDLKLIDDSKAKENSLYNYALTLAGDAEKVKYYK